MSKVETRMSSSVDTPFDMKDYTSHHDSQTVLTSELIVACMMSKEGRLCSNLNPLCEKLRLHVGKVAELLEISEDRQSLLSQGTFEFEQATTLLDQQQHATELWQAWCENLSKDKDTVERAGDIARALVNPTTPDGVQSKRALGSKLAGFVGLFVEEAVAQMGSRAGDHVMDKIIGPASPLPAPVPSSPSDTGVHEDNTLGEEADE
jgi:hypothetical protein